MPKQLNNGRVTSALQAAFGFKGRFIPMLDEVIVPVYQISDPVPAEPSRIFASRLEVDPAGLINNFATITISNPATSGALLVLSNVLVGITISDLGTLPGGQDPSMGVTAQLLDSAGIGPQVAEAVARDKRNPIPSVGTVSGSTTGAAASGLSGVIGSAILASASLAETVSGGGGTQPRQPPTVLTPGTSLRLVQSGTGAVGDIELFGFTASIAWQEIGLSTQTP